ncbi:MAG: hypothetical protein ACRYF2_22255 [Janthinobacterium lividum]
MTHATPSSVRHCNNMENATFVPSAAASPENQAFAIWLGRALKTCHEGAVHEPIPAQLLDLLPPVGKDN